MSSSIPPACLAQSRLPPELYLTTTTSELPDEVKLFDPKLAVALKYPAT